MLFTETLAALKALTEALTTISTKKSEWRSASAKHKLIEMYKRLDSLEEAGKEVGSQAKYLIRHGKLEDPQEARDSMDRWYSEICALRKMLKNEKLFVDLLKIYVPNFVRTTNVTARSCDDIFSLSERIGLHEWLGYQLFLERELLNVKGNETDETWINQNIKPLLEYGNHILKELSESKEGLRKFITETYEFKELMSE
jgi:hypothetical protein